MPKFNAPYPVALGRLLQEKRRVAGLRQSDVAKAIGTNQASISLWENGEFAPSSENIASLILFFGITDSEYVACLRLAAKAA